jgi:hypothetical protein
MLHVFLESKHRQRVGVKQKIKKIYNKIGNQSFKCSCSRTRKAVIMLLSEMSSSYETLTGVFSAIYLTSV